MQDRERNTSLRGGKGASAITNSNNLIGMMAVKLRFVKDDPQMTPEKLVCFGSLPRET